MYTFCLVLKKNNKIKIKLMQLLKYLNSSTTCSNFKKTADANKKCIRFLKYFVVSCFNFPTRTFFQY